MRTALSWLALPLALVGGGFWVATHSAATPPGSRPPRRHDWAAVDDAKLKRTFEASLTPEEKAELDDDTTRPVGHPGMRIDIQMTPQQLHDLRTANKNTARTRQEVSLAFDDGPARTALLTVHGWSTEATDRKSFLVSLFKRQCFTTGCTVKKFLLLNLLYDKGAFRMGCSYRLLAEMGLFPSYFEYATVVVNGRSEGTYLLVEGMPEDPAIVHAAIGLAYVNANEDGGCDAVFYAELEAKTALTGKVEKVITDAFGLLLPMVEFLNRAILEDTSTEEDARPIRPEPMFKRGLW